MRLSARKLLTVIVAFALLVPFISNAQKKKSPKQDKQPVIYTVKKSETLFNIAGKNKVTVAEIKKWNKLKSDKLKAGQKLIVGYPMINVNKVIRQVSEKKITGKKVAAQTVARQPQSKLKLETPPPQKKMEPDKKQDDISDLLGKNKEEIKELGMAEWIDDEDINSDKYYALHGTAPGGTIITVTNPSNKKRVYVKVVGKISAKNESENIIIKISKRAAGKLEIIASQFQAELSYSVNK